MNMIAYADDMCLIALNKNVMQNLINEAVCLIENLGLKLNTDGEKTVFCIFPKKNEPYNNSDISLYVNNNVIKQVTCKKYLGFILDNNLTYNDDVINCTLNFNKQFFSLYRKLNYLDSKNLIFLFKSYCMSFYPVTNWYCIEKCKHAFNNLKVMYRKHLKRIFKVNKHYSSHLICKQADVFTFPHFANAKTLSHIRNIVSSNHSCMKQLRYYFEREAVTVNKFLDHFENVYQVRDIFYNDIDALFSRIKFVEDREPISNYYHNH